jgi:flagellar basal body-associated protein FliL
MKSGKFLIIAIVVGWIAIMAIVGFVMMNEDSQADSNTIEVTK